MNRTRRLLSTAVALLCISFACSVRSTAQTANPNADSELLNVREQVWRAWFANDTKALRELVPADTIVISSSDEKWKSQADVLQEAVEFQAEGGKLTRLEFPHTEVQHFGDVAIVWSKYIVGTETHGKSSLSSGRATEIFVLRDGKWTNPGWHTDSFK
jgi:ketosteroid isomerase-like protein